MRAWCRLEMMSHLFSKINGQIIVAESESRVYLAANNQWLYNAPGEGQLTCCRLGHKVDRHGIEVTMPCDREAIGRVMRQLYQDKLNLHLMAGDLESFRLFLSLEVHLLAGLRGPPVPAAVANLTDFLDRYKFKTPFDEEGKQGSGWSPLRFAAYEENVSAAQQLLELKADVECMLKKPRADVWHTKNFSILTGACKVNGNPNVLRLLLDHRANLHSLTVPGRSMPADHCVFHPEGFRVLVERGYDVNDVRNIIGSSVISNACLSGAPTVPFFLAQGVLPRRCAFGTGHITAAVLGGEESALQALLAVDSEVEHAKRKGSAYGLGRLILAAAAAANLASNDPLHAFLAEWHGSSPLHFAAAEGKVRATQLLLAHGFTMEARNQRGRTPIHMACLFGHLPVLHVLASQHGFHEAARIKCSHAGKTAAELAQAAGFLELLVLLPEVEDVPPHCCGRHLVNVPSKLEEAEDDEGRIYSL